MSEKKTFSVRLPVDLYLKLEDIAWKEKKCKGDIIVECLENLFKKPWKGVK